MTSDIKGYSGEVYLDELSGKNVIPEFYSYVARRRYMKSKGVKLCLPKSNGYSFWDEIVATAASNKLLKAWEERSEDQIIKNMMADFDLVSIALEENKVRLGESKGK